jgi:hypothetical protein
MRSVVPSVQPMRPPPTISAVNRLLIVSTARTDGAVTTSCTALTSSGTGDSFAAAWRAVRIRGLLAFVNSRTRSASARAPAAPSCCNCSIARLRRVLPNKSLRVHTWTIVSIPSPRCTTSCFSHLDWDILLASQWGIPPAIWGCVSAFRKPQSRLIMPILSLRLESPHHMIAVLHPQRG